MSADLTDTVNTLTNLMFALEALNGRSASDEPAPESDGCCKDMDAAHEHGYERGYWDALEYALDTIESGNP